MKHIYNKNFISHIYTYYEQTNKNLSLGIIDSYKLFLSSLLQIIHRPSCHFHRHFFFFFKRKLPRVTGTLFNVGTPQTKLHLLLQLTRPKSPWQLSSGEQKTWYSWFRSRVNANKCWRYVVSCEVYLNADIQLRLSVTFLLGEATIKWTRGPVSTLIPLKLTGQMYSQLKQTGPFQYEIILPCPLLCLRDIHNTVAKSPFCPGYWWRGTSGGVPVLPRPGWDWTNHSAPEPRSAGSPYELGRRERNSVKRKMNQRQTDRTPWKVL